MHVGDALAIAELQRFQFVRRENPREFVFAHGAQAVARHPLGQRGIERGAMAVGDGKKALEEFLRIGPAANGEEIDELDRTGACGRRWRAAPLHQAAQAGEEAVMADAQQRSARHVADAGRLDHDGAGPAARKALVPRDDFVGDKALFGRPPWHHGGHPGALRKRHRPDIDGREQPRRGRFGRGGNTSGRPCTGCVAAVATRPFLRVSWARNRPHVI